MRLLLLGHSNDLTQNLHNDEPVKNALVDLYLLADSDAMIVCRDSAFGLAALSLTRARRTLTYHVAHSVLSNFNGTSGVCLVERDVL